MAELFEEAEAELAEAEEEEGQSTVAVAERYTF